MTMTPYENKWISVNPKQIATDNKVEVSKKVEILKNKWIIPNLSIILIWNDDSARIYAETKKKIWWALWIEVTINSFPEWVSAQEVQEKIISINNNPNIQGIMIESPVPKSLNYDELLSKVSPEKDVDWLHPNNLWKILSKNMDWLQPATPLACVSILEQIFPDVKWLKITIIGRGKTVWLPLSGMLINKWATVTSCNSNTKNLQEECLNADVIITATWVKWLITSDMVNKDSIVIDAWITLDENWMVIGDADYENIVKIARYTTPVPGWVWPVTTSIIFQNLIKAIQLQEKQNPFWISMDDFISLSKWPGMPGGGWIACLSAIYAVSMISMVYALTKWVDKNEYSGKVDEIISKLKEYYTNDITSFQRYLNALKLPKNTEDEQNARNKVIASALIECSKIPLSIAETCIEILELAKKCYQVGNKNVLTDVKVGVNLAIAAGKSALEPIEMNLNSIKDENIKSELLTNKENILTILEKFVL